MQAEQRAPIPKKRFKPSATVWRPAIILEPDEREELLEPSGDEQYVVVEEKVDGLVMMEVSAWPVLDQDGRLHFTGEPWSLYGLTGEVQAIVNRARIGHSQVGAERQLRIGDVFMTTGLEKGAESLDDAKTLVDVSAGARSAAKAALYGAVASTVDEDYMEEMAVEGPSEPPEAAGYFDMRQQRTPPPDYRSETLS